MQAYLSGLIAALWLPIGVWIAARKYPGYDHSRQFLSELGARGAPTQKLSPVINNFPLALLFGAFAVALIQTPGFFAIGICVLAHGIGTAIAGLFPMDRNHQTPPNSATHRMHLAAGMVMFFSLFIAQIIGAWISSWGWGFQSFSLTTAILSVYLSARIVPAVRMQKNPGLFQRLGYGAQIIWLAGLALFLLFNPSTD